MRHDVERELAIRSVLEHPAFFPPAQRDPATYAYFSTEFALGVPLRTLIDALGSLDETIGLAILAHVTEALVEVRERSHGVFAVPTLDDIWLPWSGGVHLCGSLATPGARPEEHLVELARVCGGLAPPTGAVMEPAYLRAWYRAQKDAAPIEGNPLSLLPGLLAATFPHERERDLEWIEELCIDESSLAPLQLLQPVDLQTAQGLEHLLMRTVVIDDGVGPPLLVTDLITEKVVDDLRRISSSPLLPHVFLPSALPLTNVTFEQAQAIVARLRPASPFRLPTEPEWERLSEGGAVGRPSRFGVRGLCRVWEMTSTPRHGGFIVRGGPFRDRKLLADVGNRSWEDQPAPDIGFRAVRDLAESGETEWESRT